MRKLFLVSLLTLATSVFAGPFEETFDRTLNVQPGSDFLLDNVNGRIIVASWDQPQVRIHAVKRVETHDEKMARQTLADLKIDVMREGRTITVKTKQPRGSDWGFLGFHHIESNVDYEITVPRSMNVHLETVNGAITAADLNGRIELDTTNGKIDVARATGSIDAETTNGSIKVELLQVTAGKSLNFETTNGSISLTVPSNLAADIDADTTNGAIRSDLPMTTRSHSRTSLRGSINGGGQAIVLRTTNGRIDLKSSAATRASK